MLTTSDLRVLGRSILFALVICTAMYAGNAAPCQAPGWDYGYNDGNGDPQTINTVVLSSAGSSFCVDDFGFSRVWYPWAQPANYDASVNTLGASGIYIMYNYDGGGVIGEWLAPQVYTDSGWQTGAGDGLWFVDQAVSAVGNTATSIINDGIVQVTITTTISGGEGVKITYAIKNIAAATITDLAVVEYFDYHPTGVGNADGGSMSYSPISTMEGTIVQGLLSGGSPNDIDWGAVCGGWAGGCASHPDGAVIGNAGAGAGTVFDLLSSLTTPLPDPDVTPPATKSNPAAGAIQYNLSGALLPNGQETFTLEMVPEPATWSFLLGAGLMFAAWRRRRA